MPDPNRSFIPCAQRLLFNPELTQDAFSQLGLNTRDPYCECTVSTVLLKSKGKVRPPCKEMPWLCPKRHLNT